MPSMQQYYRPEKRFNVPKEVKTFITKSWNKIKSTAKKHNITLNEKQEYRFKAVICDTYNYHIHVSGRYKAVDFKLFEVIPQKDNKIFFNYGHINTKNDGTTDDSYEGVILRPTGKLTSSCMPYLEFKERYLPDNFQF